MMIMEATDDKILLMFVPAFSSDGIEEFFEKELPYLLNRFKKIEIFSFKNNPPPDLDPKIEVSSFSLYKPYGRIKFLIKNFKIISQLFVTEVKQSRFKRKYILNPIKNLYMLLNKLNDAVNFIEYIKKYEGENIICYSYWFNHWAGVCALSKYLDPSLKYKLVTRIHGGDYQLGQRPEGYFPFRNVEISQVDNIISVSDYARKYLKDIGGFDKLIKKMEVSHLGVFDQGNNPELRSDKFTIVTCSSLIPLKRVHLMPKVLEYISFDIRWIHFGGGPLMEIITKKAAKLPPNIEIDFKGWVSNENIYKFYNQNHVDLFINLSEFEGIPVSIMEAISFGIPVVGANICGVPEIVTTQTGYLIEKDFNPLQLAELLTWLKNNPNHYEAKRKNVKEFWRNEFNAEINYKELTDKLLQT